MATDRKLEDKPLSTYLPPALEKVITDYLEGDVDIKPINGQSYSFKGLKLFQTTHDSLSSIVGHHVLWGKEPEHLRIILLNNTHLLHVKTKSIDPAGRKIYGTPYQKALGAGDFEMAAMLKEFLTKEEEEEQYLEQFPKDWETKAAEKLEAHVKALNEVWNALKEAKSLTYGALVIECKPAIDRFKEYLLAENDTVITSGKHFDWLFFIIAIVKIEQNIHEINGWHKPKEDIFWESIFGSLQLRVSARDMHELLRGLKNFDKEKPAPRTLTYDNGLSVYSRNPSGSLVGDNALICYGQGVVVGCSWRSGFRGHDIQTLESRNSYRNYVLEKMEFGKIYAATKQSAKP